MFSRVLEAELEAELGPAEPGQSGGLSGAPLGEASQVVRAIAAGQTDEDDLTDMLFFQRYPDRRQEWDDLRKVVVRPVLWEHIRSRARESALGELRWWRNGRRFENEPRVQDKLLDYWCATPSRPRLTSGPIWKPFWSAAFVSWIMQQAGAGHYFRYSGRHVDYVHQAIRNVKNSTHPIKALPVEQVQARVGDVVCAWRSRPITYAQLASATTPPSHPMHCEVVTEVAPDHLVAVSGNTSPPRGVSCPGNQTGCTVNARRHGLAGGHLAPRPGTGHGWVAVLRIGP
jgi:hypothetical protein